MAIKINRPSFDEIFSAMCQLVAMRSACMRRKIGAVITKNNRVIATGYNGPPKGIAHCDEIGGCIRNKLNIKSGTQLEVCRGVHAEQNALLQAGIKNTRGATIYINGYPCKICAKLIIQAEITRVVVSGHYADTEGIEMIKSAGIKVDWIEVDIRELVNKYIIGVNY